MVVGFSFGSFGDIVALIQIASKIKRALQDTHGSVREYQDLLDDISKFVDVLGQVIATYKRYEYSPLMYSLAHAVKTVVEESITLLETARDTWCSEYKDCLGPRSSVNLIIAAYKKIKFRSEREGIACLREKLAKNTACLGLLTGLVVSQSAQCDNDSLMQRVEEVNQTIEARNVQSLEVFRSIDSKFDAMKMTVARQSGTLVGILLLLQVIYKAVCNFTKALESHVENALTNSRPVYALDPTRDQDMILDDAFGRRHYFQCNVFHNWHAFDFMLAHQFQGRKGVLKVQRMEYALEESFSGKELDRRAPIRFVIRPGMKIDMSMIFVGIKIDGICPRCKTRAHVTEGVTVLCQIRDCGMQFRCTGRLVVLFKSKGSRSAWSPFDETRQIEELDDDAPREPDIAYEPPSADVIEPSDFKRVHLIEERSSHIQARQPAPSSGLQVNSTPSDAGAPNFHRVDNSEETAYPVAPTLQKEPFGSISLPQPGADISRHTRDRNQGTKTWVSQSAPAPEYMRSGSPPLPPVHAFPMWTEQTVWVHS